MGTSRTANGSPNFSTTAAFIVFVFGILHLLFARTGTTLALLQKAVCIIGHSWLWHRTQEGVTESAAIARVRALE
jgi:hypothetical protein